MKVQSKHSVIASLLALGMLSASLLGAGTANANDLFNERLSDRRVVDDRYSEYGDVIDVQPVYQDIRVREPRQECWVETQQKLVGYESPRYQSSRYDRQQTHRSNERHSTGGTVVGSIIGGVIGNQIARGSNRGARTGATIAGAIIGGAVANESQGNVVRHRNPPARRVQRGAPIYQTVEVERCKQVSASRLEQRIQHYDVTYRYQGRTYTTRTDRDPGRRIELQVSISPARQ